MCIIFRDIGHWKVLTISIVISILHYFLEKKLIYRKLQIFIWSNSNLYLLTNRLRITLVEFRNAVKLWKLKWYGCHTMKNFDDMFRRFDIPERLRNRQTHRQTDKQTEQSRATTPSLVLNKKAQLSLTNPRDAKACQNLLRFDVLTTLSLTILVYLHSFSCCCVRNLRNPEKFSKNSNL